MGEAAQETLKQSRVLIIGMGGLGCPALLYLAAAGVGHISIMDFDVVESSNLQRQILFEDADLGLFKAEIAALKVQKLHFYQNIQGLVCRFDEHSMDILQNFDLVLDCTDGIASKFFINDAAVFFEKPLVYAAANQFEGCLSVFNYKGGPNYRDLYPEQPKASEVPGCAENGILGAFVGVLGSMQATEAIKCLLNKPKILTGKLLFINALDWQTRIFKFISHGKKITARPVLGLEKSSCESVPKINTEILLSWYKASYDVLLVDVREVYERVEMLPKAQAWAWSEWQHKTEPLLPFAHTDSQKLVFYCQSGVRSHKAALKFLEAGHSEVYNLGGIQDWGDLL